MNLGRTPRTAALSGHHGPMKGSVGGPLAGLAAIMVVAAGFLPFWDGAKGYELAIRGLWQGYNGLSAARFITSIALVLCIGGVILLGSAVAGSQALSFLGCFWVFGLLALFTSQARASTSVEDFLLNEVDWGFWVAAGGALLALVAGFIPRSVSTEYRH